jgi:hypothetical protein
MDHFVSRSESSTPSSCIASSDLPIIGIDGFRTPEPPNPDLKRFGPNQYRRCYIDRKKRPRTKWYWDDGTAWEETSSGVMFWVCKHCRSFKPIRAEGRITYKITSSEVPKHDDKLQSLVRPSFTVLCKLMNHHLALFAQKIKSCRPAVLSCRPFMPTLISQLR